MKCRYGFDAAHEELAALNGALKTSKERQYRRLLKETTFACHYGTSPCGWYPEPSQTPIYDRLKREFQLSGRLIPILTVHSHDMPLKEHLFKYHTEETDPGSIFYGYAITERLHDQMHEYRRQQMTILRYEEGLPGVFVK